MQCRPGGASRGTRPGTRDTRKRHGPGSGTPPGIGIAGGAPGTNAILDGDLPGGVDLVVLANLDPPAAERLARTIRGWLGAND